MDNINLIKDSAIQLLLSPRMKEYDPDFEFTQKISRSEHHFMAYLPGRMRFEDSCASLAGVPKIRYREALELSSALKLSLPLSVCVETRANRRSSRSLESSVLPVSARAGAFFQVCEGVSCAAPELTLLSVANSLSNIELIVLMSLMFSVFTKSAESGSLMPRRSICMPEDVQRFLDECERSGEKLADGASRLKRLLPLAIVKAASPKEIECAMRLGYSTDQGGCGLGLPKMNYQLSIPSTKRNRYCDLYWPTQNVAVEYQGAEEHTSLAALEADALHGNDLISIDVPAFTLTANQLASLTLFNRTARQIERRLGAPKFPTCAEFHEKQRLLKAQIDAAFKRFGY